MNSNLLPTAELGRVHRDEQPLDTALLGVLDELFRNLALLVDVPGNVVSALPVAKKLKC